MTAEELIAAFDLPAACRVDQRVPKKNFLEYPGLASADRKAIREGIEEIRWLAALLPETIAVATHETSERRYRQIGLLRVAFRPKAPVPRLLHLIHRCTAHPVLLVTDEAPCRLSLCHKRLSLAESGKTVLDDHGQVRTSPSLTTALPGLESFLATLPVPAAPAADLFHLYQRWQQSITSLDAASICGSYHVIHHAEEESVVRESIESHTATIQEIATLRRDADKEKQLARRVDLNLRIKRLETTLLIPTRP